MLFDNNHKKFHENYVNATKEMVAYFREPLSTWGHIRDKYYHALSELRLFLDCNNCKMTLPVKFYDPREKSTWTYQE